MKIIIFSTAYFPYIGGAEVAVKEITDRIEDISFELITPRYSRDLPREEKIGNVLVHRVGFGTVFDKFLIPFLGVFEIRRIVKKSKVDLFWCMMASFAGGAAYLHNALFFWKKIPITLTLQEGSSDSYVKKGRLGVVGLSLRLALSKAKALTVISSYLGERAKSFGYEGDITLVPNGVDINKFKARSLKLKDKKELKRRLGLKESDKVVVTTSRLEIKNGVGDVIRAMEHLPKDFHFVIVGSGGLEKSLKRKSKELGFEKRVHFIGNVGHEEIPLYLSISDVFIRPSLSEGMGISFIEAMAAKIPVVATPVGGIPDFVFDPDRNPDVRPTGIFAEVGDEKSIAVSIQKAVFDRELRQDIIENASEMVEKRYSWDMIAPRMKEALTDTLARHEK